MPRIDHEITAAGLGPDLMIMRITGIDIAERSPPDRGLETVP